MSKRIMNRDYGYDIDYDDKMKKNIVEVNSYNNLVVCK